MMANEKEYQIDEDDVLFYNGYHLDEGSYCTSVLGHSTHDKQNGSYILSDSNVIKLLHDLKFNILNVT